MKIPQKVRSAVGAMSGINGSTNNPHAWGLLVERVTAGCKLASVWQSPAVLETDKRPDGEKARVKEWPLASRKDGN